MKCFLAALLLAFTLASHAYAAAEDFQRHALTASMLEKHRAASKDLEKAFKGKDLADGSKDGLTTDEFVRHLEATPGVKPILARHGLSTRVFALTTLALFQAGFYLAMESSMDKKKAAELLASYPAETRANIELLRKNPKLIE